MKSTLILQHPYESSASGEGAVKLNEAYYCEEKAEEGMKKSSLQPDFRRLPESFVIDEEYCLSMRLE